MAHGERRLACQKGLRVLWKQRESGGIAALVVVTGSHNPIIDPTLTLHLHLARCSTRIRRKEGKKQAIVLSKVPEGVVVCPSCFVAVGTGPAGAVVRPAALRAQGR